MSTPKKKVDCSVALKYTFDTNAPIIIAKGKGYVSKQLLKTAQLHNIPIHTDPNLTSVLVEQEIGACIPEETYRAVAAIFAFLALGSI